MKRPLRWLVASLAVSALGAAPPPAPLRGVWRGTSTCLQPAAGPACHDEVVVYRVTAPDGVPEHAHLAASKIIGGKEQPMGELDFVWDPASGSWLSEFTTPRFHGVWRFRVEGSRLTGELLLLPERPRGREVSARAE